MEEDTTPRNSASDAGPRLKFLREPRYASWVTMMWLDLLCTPLASHYIHYIHSLYWITWPVFPSTRSVINYERDSTKMRIMEQNACPLLSSSAHVQNTSIEPCRTSPLPSNKGWNHTHCNRYSFHKRILDNKSPFSCCGDISTCA